MSGRRFELLVNGEIYHVFNRSIAHEPILKSNRLLTRALELVDFYRFPQKLRYSFFKRLPNDPKNQYLGWLKTISPLIEIYAFCFMPNHFHLLVKQLVDKGIEKSISNFQNSLAKYYNLLSQRAGPVFQKPFKAKRISSNEEFLHISRYIHLNPVTSLIVKFDELKDYRWTSFPCFITQGNFDLVSTDIILELIGSKRKYKSFVENQADYQRKLHLIKHLVIE
jgi:putative transposase